MSLSIIRPIFGLIPRSGGWIVQSAVSDLQQRRKKAESDISFRSIKCSKARPCGYFDRAASQKIRPHFCRPGNLANFRSRVTHESSFAKTSTILAPNGPLFFKTLQEWQRQKRFRSDVECCRDDFADGTGGGVRRKNVIAI